MRARRVVMQTGREMKMWVCGADRQRDEGLINVFSPHY